MASRNASIADGVLARMIWSGFKASGAAVLLSCAVLLLVWTIDWICVARVWPDGINRLKEILAEDLATGRVLAASQGVSPDWIVWMANALYAALFEVTGLHRMGMTFAHGASLSVPDTIARMSYVANWPALEVAMAGTQLIGVRIATLVLLMPVLALGYVTGAADGLVQRAIRRRGGGRESASLYHRAKHLQLLVCVLLVLGALTWAGPVDIRGCGWLVAMVLAVLARTQWSYYKKHL